MTDSCYKLAAFDLGGTLLVTKSSNWYITAPVMDFLQKTTCTDEEVASSIIHAKKAVKTEVLAKNIKDEQRIYLQFYRSFFHYLHLSVPVSESMLIEFSISRTLTAEQFELNWPAIYAIEALSKHTGTALFSNTWPSVIAFLRSEGVLDAFSHTYFSCNVGVKKPDPKMFELLLADTNCKAEEVILYDDNARVIETAMKYGLCSRQITFDTLLATMKKDFPEDKLC